MAALSIKPSYPTYFGTDGLPLENGYIYIGTAGLAAITNPISIYWDSALSVAATQPVRTIGGYPSNSGAPGMLYMNGTDYSILVADKNNVDVYSALNVTEASSGATANAAAIAVNTAAIAVNTAAIATNVTNIGLNTSKLAGIEAGADVTDATNVDAAGAVMNSDTSTAAMSFVIDEDNMASDSATKVPTQQSVKAYVDAVQGNVEMLFDVASVGAGASIPVTTPTLICAANQTGIASAAKRSVVTFFFPHYNASNWGSVLTKIRVEKALSSTTAITAIVLSSDANCQPTTVSNSVNYGDSFVIASQAGRTLAAVIYRTNDDLVSLRVAQESGDDAVYSTTWAETYIYNS